VTQVSRKSVIDDVEVDHRCAWPGAASQPAGYVCG
jgi:hypothetical protein